MNFSIASLLEKTPEQLPTDLLSRLLNSHVTSQLDEADEQQERDEIDENSKSKYLENNKLRIILFSQFGATLSWRSARRTISPLRYSQ